MTVDVEFHEAVAVRELVRRMGDRLVEKNAELLACETDYMTAVEWSRTGAAWAQQRRLKVGAALARLDAEVTELRRAFYAASYAAGAGDLAATRAIIAGDSASIEAWLGPTFGGVR